MIWNRNFVKGFARFASHIIYRVKIEGLENIPKEGAAILCANHLHALDSVVVGSHIKRMVYAMGKEELFRTKFKKDFLLAMGCFPVKRGAKSEEGINQSVEILQKGDLLMIFPEGTRNGLSKGVKPKKGAARIALKAQVPIIPIGINGKFKFMSKIKVKIGKPIDLSKYYNVENESQILSEIIDNVMKEILELTK